MGTIVECVGRAICSGCESSYIFYFLRGYVPAYLYCEDGCSMVGFLLSRIASYYWLIFLFLLYVIRSWFVSILFTRYKFRKFYVDYAPIEFDACL